MELDDNQKQIIALFVKQELVIEKLYQLFAERYPDYRDFWNKMAKEEYQHSVLVERITHSDSITFSQGELRVESLNSSINYIESFMKEFKNDKNFPIDKAALKATQLEKGLWERKVFEYFESDSDEVKKILDSLNSEQRFHIKKIDRFASQFMGKNKEVHRSPN